jgi:predicted ATPase
MPLSECGTGIGQVLAMLYVVLTAEVPRTIIIDEPQSFLHPGAIRKLLDILKGYPQHQFIVSTHSSVVATASNPKTLLLLRKEGTERLKARVTYLTSRSQANSDRSYRRSALAFPMFSALTIFSG